MIYHLCRNLIEKRKTSQNQVRFKWDEINCSEGFKATPSSGLGVSSYVATKQTWNSV